MITENNAQMHKRWCQTVKPGHQTTGNTQGSIQSGMPDSNSEIRGRFCDGLGSNIVVEYSVGPFITLHGRITAKEYVDRLCNQVHPMLQTLFPNNDSFSKTTAGTVQS
jgi:hypothetical protein